MIKQRRSPTLSERLTPCECCGHPLSHRHHQLPIEYYHDRDEVAYLCANCHEIFHLMERVIRDNAVHPGRATRNVHLLSAVFEQWGDDDPRLEKIGILLEQSAELKGKYTPDKLAPFWRMIFSGMGVGK